MKRHWGAVGLGIPGAFFTVGFAHFFNTKLAAATDTLWSRTGAAPEVATGLYVLLCLWATVMAIGGYRRQMRQRDWGYVERLIAVLIVIGSGLLGGLMLVIGDSGLAVLTGGLLFSPAAAGCWFLTRTAVCTEAVE